MVGFEPLGPGKHLFFPNPQENPTMADSSENQGEITEPPNSTVDDWFGQNVARDQDVADEAVAESDSEAEAEQKFDERAEGQRKYDEGHPRPD